MDRPLSKDELIGLLGNCILALAVYKGNDPDLIREARDAAEDHVAELNRRFPGWKEELDQPQEFSEWPNPGPSPGAAS